MSFGIFSSFIALVFFFLLFSYMWCLYTFWILLLLLSSHSFIWTFFYLLLLLLLSCSVRFYLVWDFVMRLSMLILIVCWPRTVPAPPGLVAVPSIRPWIGLQNTLAVSDVTNCPTAFLLGNLRLLKLSESLLPSPVFLILQGYFSW